MTGQPWSADIRARAAENPEATAVQETSGSRATRAQLAAMVAASCAALRAQGFRSGDGVLFSVRPGVAALVLALAVQELGGVLLPMDPGVCDVLFDARVALLKPRWVFAESMLLAPPQGTVARLFRRAGMQFAPLASVSGARYVRVGPWLPGIPHATSFRALVRKGAHGVAAARDPHGEPDELAGDSPAFIVCTSGTTAHPRAVVHTRRSLAAIIEAVTAQLALGPDDVLYTRELHLMIPALRAGARIVVPREFAFDGRRALNTMRREHVTHAFLVTRDCRLLMDACLEARARVAESVRSLMIGAAPVQAPFLARLQSVLPAHTVAWCVYGATEVLPIATVSLREKTNFDGTGDLVGAVVPGVSVRIDSDGVLCVSGDRVFARYAGEAPVAEHVTGDLARLDGDRIVLLGRAKDMIIRAEHNIYPALYEPLVERVPGVRRAAMVGEFDAALADERVTLVVEPEQGVSEPDLLRRVALSIREGPHRIDRAAQPDRIVLSAIPESGRSHKVDKDALRRQLAAT